VGYILKKTKCLWPIIMFPYYERSHTRSYTGKEWLKDIKADFSCATLYLTERDLRCKIIFPPFLLIEIELSDITNISRLEGKSGLLEVRFAKAKRGLLTKLALSGGSGIPKDRVLLNLGGEAEIWYRELVNRISVGPKTST